MQSVSFRKPIFFKMLLFSCAGGFRGHPYESNDVFCFIEDVMMNRSIRKALTIMTALVFALGTLLLPAEVSHAETAAPEAQVVVTGDQLIPDGKYTPANIENEKAYSLSELKQMAGEDSGAAADNTYVYSAKNNYDNMNIYKVQGVRVAAVLNAAGLGSYAGKYAVRALDGYEIIFDPAVTEPNGWHDSATSPSLLSVSAGTRYYFPQIWRAYKENADKYTEEEKWEGAVEVPSIIGWAVGGAKENGNYQYVDPSGLTPKDYSNGQLKLSVGQVTPEDYNNPLWNGETKGLELIAGEPLSEVLVIDNQVKGNVKGYSRADIMARGGITKEQTGWYRGITLSSLASSNPFYQETTKFVLTCVDGTEVTLMGAEVLAKFNTSGDLPMLCYETGSSEASLAPILFEEADGTQSFFTVCANGHAPIERVTQIRIYNDPPQAPGTPTDLSVERAGYDSLTVSWTQVDEATGYEIFRSASQTEAFELVATVETVDKYTDTKLNTGQEYYYKIRAITTDPKTGLTACSDYTDVQSDVPSLDKPVINKITSAKKTVTLKWAKTKGANGYVIYRSMKKSGTYKAIKTIKSGKTLTFKNKKLKKGKKYFYKIRAYRNVSGEPVYSSYSAVKYIKVK